VTRILVTGARAPVALDLARAFRAAGCAVSLADSVRPFAAALSRPRFEIERLPAPRFDFPAFSARMRILAERFELIVPTCEEVFWLAAAAARDGWSERLFAPAPEWLARLHSKALFPDLARSVGIPAPETTPLASPADLRRLPCLSESLVLKPEYSRFGARTLVAPSPRQRARLSPGPGRRWVAQERIEGDELCVWSAVRGGELVGYVAYRPLLRHGRAASYAFEAVDRPDLRDMAARIGRAVGGDGQLCYDVIVTAAGRAIPIECNPRSVSGIHLFDSSPELALAMLKGSPLEPPKAGTIRYLSPAMAVMGLPAALAGGSLRRWRQVARRGEDCVGRRGDRRPVAGVVLDAARFALVGLARMRSPTGQTTDDIEWNGEPIG
jgi:hypothetical protein